MQYILAIAGIPVITQTKGQFQKINNVFDVEKVKKLNNITFLHLEWLIRERYPLKLAFLKDTSMESESKIEHDQFELLIQGLIDQKYGCCDDFLSPSSVLGLRNNLEHLIDGDKLKSSGIGSKDNFHQDNTIRGDKINWIEDSSEDEFEIAYLRKIERFFSYLNNSCYTSIKTYESHYAAYEKMSFYKRHFDQFKNQKGRQFSIILYLNSNWMEEDGGHLCLYLENGEKKEISPLGGRMIFFRSDEMEHEVLPSFTRSRFSIAGWLKND